MVQERLPRTRRTNIKPKIEYATPEVIREELFGFKIGDPVNIKQWARPSVIKKIQFQTGFIVGVNEDKTAIVHFIAWNDTEILVDANYLVQVEKISKMIYKHTYKEMVELLNEKEAELKAEKELVNSKKEKKAPVDIDTVSNKKKRWWRK